MKTTWPGFLNLLFVFIAVEGSWAIEVGQQLATVGRPPYVLSCATCHGIKGEGQPAAGFPALAGMNAVYLVNQLKAIKSGARKSPAMQPMVAALTEKEMQSVALYYSKLPMQLKVKKWDAQNEIGRRLVEYGDWSKELPSCVSCHGKKARGIGQDFPRLQGQGYSYLKTQLHAFEAGDRRGDTQGLMAHVAKKMSEAEIEAVAQFLSGQPFKSAWTEKVESGSSHHQPPVESELKDDPFSQMVKKGRDIFLDTPRHAKKYVGNSLSCVNCHLDRGRRAFAIPMWASFAVYPAYRTKTDEVNTMEERLQGCFEYSHNGTAPPGNSEIIKALSTYQYWLGRGTKIGESLPGRGLKKLTEVKARSYANGKKVYKNHCAICHGENGQGVQGKEGDGFPALWGENSYNWGAGMHRIFTASGFIKENMPLGKADLTDQQAWDVSLYINSQKRPEDPRDKGNRRATAKKHHDHDCQYNK